jgi:hypothetical protein
MEDKPQRRLNTEKGYTFGIYFPKEAPAEMVERVFDRIAKLVHGELTEDREGWDPFMVGLAGDILQIDKDCECCEPHVYLSTSCFHNDHNYCKRETGLLGNKIPGVCKFCHAPCICKCHRENTQEG